MGLFRLLKILSVTRHYGLDEIVLSKMRKGWLVSAWSAALIWRKSKEPRAQRLRRALESLGPMFIKLGQVLSTRPDILPRDITDELSSLQDKVPPEKFAAIRAQVEGSLECPLEEVFEEFEEDPVGSASIAQVHKARLIGGQVVAVKVLRPDIERVVMNDLQLMDTFAAVVEWLLKDGKRLKPRAVVGEFRKHLNEELNLKHEAANCERIANNFAGSDKLKVPKVHWGLCTREVMVMEYIAATPISDKETLLEKGIDLFTLAKNGIEIFFTEVFRDSFFHADMHPGNIHVRDDGTIVLLDFGIVGHLSDFDKEYLAKNFLAFFNRDYRKVALMHVEAGWTPPDTPIHQFETELHAVCEPIFAKPLKDISFGKLLVDLFRTARNFNVQVQPQLVLLQKTLLNIEGLGRELYPDINLWETAKPMMESWASERYSLRGNLKQLREKAPDLVALIPESAQIFRALLARNREPDPAGEIAELRAHLRRLQAAGVGIGALLLIIYLLK